jgi:chaperonin cofactor prefoldin
VAAAATQEIDRQQQADKVRIAELETNVSSLQSEVSSLQSQLSNVLSRLSALENP